MAIFAIPKHYKTGIKVKFHQGGMALGIPFLMAETLNVAPFDKVKSGSITAITPCSIKCRELIQDIFSLDDYLYYTKKKTQSTILQWGIVEFSLRR